MATQCATMARPEDAVPHIDLPNSKLNPWLRKYRERLLKEGLNPHGQPYTNHDVNDLLLDSDQPGRQKGDEIDRKHKSSDPVVDTHDGINVYKTNQQYDENVLPFTDVMLNHTVKSGANKYGMMTKNDERVDNKQEHELPLLRDKENTKYANEPRHDDEKATDTTTHKKSNTTTLVNKDTGSKEEDINRSKNLNSIRKNTKQKAPKLNTIQPIPIHTDSNPYRAFPQTNEPLQLQTSSEASLVSSSRLGQHVLAATDDKIPDSSHQNNFGSTNEPMHLYSNGSETETSPMVTSIITKVWGLRSGHIKHVNDAPGEKNVLKQKGIIQDQRGIGIKEGHKESAAPKGTVVHVNSEAKFKQERTGVTSELKSDPNKDVSENVTSWKSDQQSMKSLIEYSETKSGSKLQQGVSAEIKQIKNQAFDVDHVLEASRNTLMTHRDEVHLESSTLTSPRQVDSNNGDFDKTTVDTSSNQQPRTMSFTYVQVRTSASANAEQIKPTSYKPAAADVNREPELNPIDNYMLSGGYSKAALVTGVVVGMGVGGGLVVLVFYCKRRCSRLIKGDYRPVPMEYDFELNPRFKNT